MSDSSFNVSNFKDENARTLAKQMEWASQIGSGDLKDGTQYKD